MVGDFKAGLYRHYKGGLYQALGIAAHSVTDERMVVYVALTAETLPGPRLRVRPLHLWEDEVPWPDSGTTGPRFRYEGVEVP